MNFVCAVTSLVVVLLSISANNAGRLKQILLSALNDQISLSKADLQQIMDTAHDLKPDELRSLLPLGMECLRSSHENGRSAGVTLFRGAWDRADGPVLLEPYISDFGDCLKIAQCSYQRWAVLWLLATTNPPKLSETAGALLVSNLEDETDTFNDLVVVMGLITNFPSDLSMRRRVLNVVQQRSDNVVKSEAVRSLRKVDRLGPDDLVFIRSCLADDNPWVVAAAIDLLADIAPNVREQFMDQLRAIAAESRFRDVEAALERFFERISPTHDSSPKKP